MTKKREDSFLGIHFDFHAMSEEIVARYFCPDVLTLMLDSVKPDFIQVDTKGHPGLSSYPTLKGTQAKEIKEDLLAFWREETKKRDIALYGHHSGLFDMNVVKTHPDWAVKGVDGKINEKYVSPFSPYADEVLIPQLKELALDYNLDGAWIDGECWASVVDYSDYAQNAYFEKYQKKAPLPDDSDYEEYREFCRQGFRNYIQHYVEEVKKLRPDFQITSNWIYSPYMSEKPTVKVDFLSGDYTCSNAVISGRHFGRYLAARDMTWDLMSWGQNARPCSWETNNRSTKELNQYLQEASIIIALGGGFQFFNIAYCGGGYVQKWAIPIWERTAEFCREREICHKAKPYSNIAVMVPFEVPPHETDNLFTTWLKPELTSFYTWLSALCDIQLSPNVIFESSLDETDLTEYELIVLPNCHNLGGKALEVLTDFVKNGGKIIADIDAVDSFKNITGINTLNRKEELRYLASNGSLSAFYGNIAHIYSDKETFGELYSENYFENDSISMPSAYTENVENGKIYLLNFDFTEVYKNNITSTVKNWLRDIIKDSEINVPIKVTGSGYVEVITTKKDNDLFINLINLTGDHRLPEVRSYNEIVPLYNLTVEVDKVKEIAIIPKNKFTIEESDNNMLITVDKLEIHTVLIIKDYFK